MAVSGRRLGAMGLLLVVPWVAGCGSSIPPEPRPKMAEVARIRAAFELAGGGGSSSSGNAAGGQQPAGWATLRGVFTLNGEPPPAPVLNINKHPEVCAPGGKTVYAESLVVDPATKGIANVVVYVDRIPDAWVHESARGATDEVVFDQKECVFLTHVAKMQTSQTLKILNSDPVGHNTKTVYFNKNVGSGETASFEPAGDTREPINVSCSVHPWMEAWLLIRENAYMAVTGPDGSFEIPNLPAGVELQFKVWQEKAKYLENVTLNGSGVKWPKGRMKVTLAPDSDTSLEVVVNASEFN